MDEPPQFLTVHHPMPLMPKTIPMRIAASGIALMLLASLSAGLWVFLPRWCPRYVIRYSPWVEPVLRAHEFEDYGYPFDSEFDVRFQCWGGPVLPYLHRVLFTHSDSAMRHASFDALSALAGWTDTRRFSGRSVIEATFIALSDNDRFPDTGQVAEIGEWLEEGRRGPDALHASFQSLDSRRQAVLVSRLPFQQSEYWFRQNHELFQCYLKFLANPELQLRNRSALILRRMTMEAAFPDCYFVAQMIQPELSGTLASALTDLVRSLDEPSDVSGIIAWLGKSSDQPVAQMHLAYACTVLRNPATVSALTASLAATDPGVRIHALQALRDIGDVRAFDAVIPLLADPDESVRCMAVWTIGRLRDQRAPELMKKALDDSDPLVVRAAERSLAEFLPPASTVP